MNDSNNSTSRVVRRQKLGMILIPPITIIICLLVGIDLISTTMVTLATVFPASLYSRRLTTRAEIAPSNEQVEGIAEILKERENIVTYKTSEGPQIIGFYKILQQPQGYGFHTLRMKFAKANLTLYPMIHANGTFLTIHYCDNSNQNQQRHDWEVFQHLEAFTQTLMQKLPGLELEPASFTDVNSLVGVFGLKISKATRESSQATNKPDHRNPERDDRITQDQPPAEENLRKYPRQSDGIIPGNERSVNNIPGDLFSFFEPFKKEFSTRKHDNTIIKESATNSPESDLLFLNKRIDPGMSGKDTLGTLTDTYRKVLATIEGVQGDANAVPVTPTAKRIAGHLVVKNLVEVLDTLQALAGLPPEIQTLVNAFQTYFAHYFGDPTVNSVLTKTEALWEQIPGMVVVVGMILEKLDAMQLSDQQQWTKLSQKP